MTKAEKKMIAYGLLSAALAAATGFMVGVGSVL